LHAYSQSQIKIWRQNQFFVVEIKHVFSHKLSLAEGKINDDIIHWKTNCSEVMFLVCIAFDLKKKNVF
jgi:hypothetical protein